MVLDRRIYPFWRWSKILFACQYSTSLILLYVTLAYTLLIKISVVVIFVNLVSCICSIMTNTIQSIWQIFPNNPDHTIHCKKIHKANTGLFHSKFWYTSRHYFYSFIIFIHPPNAEDFHMRIEKKVTGKYVNEWSPAAVDLALLAYISSRISS